VKNVWILVGICTYRISLHVLLDATKIEWKVVAAAAAAAAAAESLINWAKDLIILDSATLQTAHVIK
jgi:hypothetical protein